MGKGNHASNIRKIGKSYETDLTKPNIEGYWLCFGHDTIKALDFLRKGFGIRWNSIQLDTVIAVGGLYAGILETVFQ